MNRYIFSLVFGLLMGVKLFGSTDFELVPLASSTFEIDLRPQSASPAPPPPAPPPTPEPSIEAHSFLVNALKTWTPPRLVRTQETILLSSQNLELILDYLATHTQKLDDMKSLITLHEKALKFLKEGATDDTLFRLLSFYGPLLEKIYIGAPYFKGKRIERREFLNLSLKYYRFVTPAFERKNQALSARIEKIRQERDIAE